MVFEKKRDGIGHRLERDKDDIFRVLWWTAILGIVVITADWFLFNKIVKVFSKTVKDGKRTCR